MNPDIQKQVDQYVEAKFQVMIQEYMAKFNENQLFGVPIVPSHVHNGVDSSQIEFLSLSDTPKTYSGKSGKATTVNSSETGLEFTTVTTAPGGSDTQVQFNDGGVFAGNSHMTFAKSTNTFTLASGSLAVFNGKLKLPVGTNLYP